MDACREKSAAHWRWQVVVGPCFTLRCAWIPDHAGPLTAGITRGPVDARSDWLWLYERDLAGELEIQHHADSSIDL